MKRTFTRALTLSCFIGAMMGCAKNDQLTAVDGDALSFETYVGGNTKGLSKSAFKMGDQFGILATKSTLNWTASDADWFMGLNGNQPSTIATNTDLDGTQPNAWKYGTIQLWPEVEKLSFFAYSPVDMAYTVAATAGSPVVSFEVDPIVKDQVDFLAAEALDQTSAGGAVSLQFRHALTRVTFAAKANVATGQMVRLEKIELVGIKSKGDLKIYDPKRVVGAEDDMGGWSNQDVDASYAPALTHEVVGKVPSDVTPMTAEDQALLMIPQKFTKGGDAKLKVTYAYTNDGTSWVNGSVIEIDMAEYTQCWNPGKNYRYTLTLSPDKIYSFSGTVQPWGSDLNLDVKNPLSVTLLDLDPTGGKPHEVVVAETRGLELGYKLKSTAPTRVTISDAEAGTYAGEVEYKSDGSVVAKAYEMEKKWYIKVKPNLTEKAYKDSVLLIREGADTVVLEVKQERGLPFKDVTAPTLPAYMTSPTTKVTGMVVPNHSGAKYKIKTASTWFKLSLDGVGDGAEEVEVFGNASDNPVDFYVHTSTHVTKSTRNADVVFEATSADGTVLEMGKVAVKQTQDEYFIGNFAGALKSKVVGGEVHWYFDKLLFAASVDESGTYKWQNTSSVTNIRDMMDGKGNTEKLAAVVAPNDSPAAKQCYDKNSTPSNQFYLPAFKQLHGLWIAKPVLGTFAADYYWSSTEYDVDVTCAWYVHMSNGLADWNSKSNHSVRCVREHEDASVAAANKVIKGADGKVYIDVQGMPSGAWKSTTLNSVHNEKSATNSLFKKIEVDKSDLTTADWNVAKTNCSNKGAGWRLPTQRELQLMWIMKDALEVAGVDAFAAAQYWSSTESSSNSSGAWIVRFSTGYTYYTSKTNTNNVRCIREVN